MTEFLLWIGFLALTVKVIQLSGRVRVLEAGREPVALPHSEPTPEPAPMKPVFVPLPPVFELEPEETKPASVDWEALLGGNLLNKAGVLLLMVGMALLIGYSMRSMGPAGRIALGAAVSGAMLVAGISAEKREAYSTFGHGLIGGGWAGLYFTAFAAAAIPAAQVITNPTVATLVLTAVAIAMIGHSLKYESETITGMAHLVAFLTLAISGVPLLAIIATIPLAASAIYLSYRFGWTRLISAGLPIAYGVFFLQSQSITAPPELLKLLLVTYWIVFEAAAVLRPSSSRLPFLLNAICFSFLAWGSPVLAACAYGASTAMRAASKREYRGSLTACSLLCALAIFNHTSGLTTVVALLFEAELLFLAGVRLEERFLRWLAAAGFTVAVPQLILTAFTFSSHTDWSILTAATAILMYVNRYLHRESWMYSWAGTALLVIAPAYEIPTEWMGVAWLILAGMLGEIFKRDGSREFRMQSMAVGALALGMLAVVNVMGMDHGAIPWQPQLAAAVLLFAGSVRSGFVAPASAAGSVMTAVLLWNVLPEPLVALGWGAAALALFEIGSLYGQPWIVREGEAMALAAFGRIFFANIDISGTSPVIALQYYLYARGRRWFVYTGAIAAATLIRFEAGRVLAVTGWALMALACQFLGTRRDNRDLRIQAFLLAGATVVRCWTTNFYEPDALSRVWIGGIVIACLFAAQLVSRRDPETFARPLFSTLASCLLSVLLFHEVSGKLLTMAWAVQGALLLSAGFALRERHVRLTGLALLTACVAKLFFYDFSTLDTPYRIASFLVLGLLLIGGSWVYTRFRKQLEGVL